MTCSEWLSSEKAITKSRKNYSHFDYRVDLSNCKDYISDPNKVAEHGFYPFIHYKKQTIKYNGKTRQKKTKNRDICYAAHLDRCIYQYYSYILNELYNSCVYQNGISDVPIAYRTDLGKSNIYFAHKAFEYIRTHKPCYIMIGDFTGFFDNLDHSYLKQMWCQLIGCPCLPQDHYNIYKNVTKYSTWDRSDILALNGLEDNQKGIDKLNKKERVLTTEQFNHNKAQIHKNQSKYGIPQGSSISAVLANLYMMDIDKQIHDTIHPLEGMFMRYSDDFIVILPVHEQEKDMEVIKSITRMINDTPGLTLQPEKTQYFYCDESHLTNCGEQFHTNADSRNSAVCFLGFSFDGNKVSIRSKTITKYYYRMYRKAKNIVKAREKQPQDDRPSTENLYRRYSERGAYGKKGNFFTYVNNAKKEFGSQENIDHDTRKHMQKIRKALK